MNKLLRVKAVVPKLMHCAEHFKNFSGLRSTKNLLVLYFEDHLSKTRGPLVASGADFGNHWVKVNALYQPVLN